MKNDKSKTVLNEMAKSLKPAVEFLDSSIRMYSEIYEITKYLAYYYEKIQYNYQNIIKPLSVIINEYYNMTKLLNFQVPLIQIFEKLNQLEPEKKEKIKKELKEFEKKENVCVKNDDDISTEITNISNEIVYSGKSTRYKKNLFQRFVGLLLKIFEVVLLPFVLFLIQPYYEQYIESIPEKTVIEQSFDEIYQIKQEQEVEYDYRVVNHNTNLYTSVKLTSVLQQLEIGDILIVLETNGKLLKVQDYQTGNIGYIRKKYTEKR